MLNAKQLEAERRLIEASQREPRRFARLYERYFDRVYAFALTRTGDRTAADDVTAETFRRALQNLSRFRWRGVPFSAWLFRIAANAAADGTGQNEGGGMIARGPGREKRTASQANAEWRGEVSAQRRGEADGPEIAKAGNSETAEMD